MASIRPASILALLSLKTSQPCFADPSAGDLLQGTLGSLRTRAASPFIPTRARMASSTAPSTGIDFGDGLKRRRDPACIQRQHSPMQRGTPEHRAPGIDILRNMPFPHHSVAQPCLESRARTTNPLRDVLQPLALSGPSSLKFPRDCSGMGLVSEHIP